LHGRVGTPMPPFKDELDPESQGDVIAYVLWLTSGGSLPQSVVLSSTQGSNTSSSPNSSSTSVAIGKDSGRPAVGAALFFDPTKLYSCQTCHSYSHMGGPIGPDLANSSKSPLDIYRNLVHADVKASGFPGVAVGFRAGGGLRGIKSQETEDAIMVFDLSSLPPVERTIPKTEILTLSEIRDSGIYDHTQLPFTKQNLLDLSGFLGAATSKDLRKHLLN
jgi:mono/diheme cytochrome c family protein